MSKMAIAPKDRPRVQLECARLLVTLQLNPAKQHLISRFFFTYLDLTAQEMEVYRRLRDKLGKHEQEAIMHYAGSERKHVEMHRKRLQAAAPQKIRHARVSLNTSH